MKRWRWVLAAIAAVPVILVVAFGWAAWNAQRADYGWRPLPARPAFATGAGPTVAIDHGHHNASTANWWGRYWPFGELLRADGYRVRYSDSLVHARDVGQRAGARDRQCVRRCEAAVPRDQSAMGRRGRSQRTGVRAAGDRCAATLGRGWRTSVVDRRPCALRCGECGARGGVRRAHACGVRGSAGGGVGSAALHPRQRAAGSRASDRLGRRRRRAGRTACRRSPANRSMVHRMRRSCYACRAVRWKPWTTMARSAKPRPAPRRAWRSTMGRDAWWCSAKRRC